MIEDNKWVSNVEAKPGGRSGTYWTVTWHDGKFDNIFNGEWLPIVEKAQAEKLCVHFKKEKPEGSKYFNIVELSLVEANIPPPAKPKVSEREQKVVEEAGSSTSMPQDRDERIVYQVVMKEVGELYRAGLFVEDKDHPVDRKLIAKYKNWICKTLGVSVEHKEE